MRLIFEHCVDAPLEAVFSFHENPGNLALLLADLPGFRMLHHARSIRKGNTTWFEVRVARILPVVLGFRHVLYEPPHRFGERLIHGPFSEFTHVHEFHPDEWGTLVRDVIEIRLPWWYGGEFVMRSLVAPLIARTFRLRQAAIMRLAEGRIKRFERLEAMKGAES